MGKVMTRIKVENLGDLEAVERKYIVASQVRNIEIDALVDTGAAFLCLSSNLIDQLGLTLMKEVNVDTADGVKTRKKYRGAYITIMDRSCAIDVVEINSRIPALVGYLILEALDLVVDPQAQIVTGNPEHDGQMIIDLL